MTSSVDVPAPSRLRSILVTVWGRIKNIAPIIPIFIAILLGVSYLNPQFANPDGVLLYLRRAAPLAILAMGQLFVLATGGFDLSQGSLVTLTVIGSSLIIYNNESYGYIAIFIMLVLGILVGLTNGLVVSFLKVPSLIATLGMMLLIKGGGLYWTGGAPKGYLTENWRYFGRGYIENIPVIGRFPVAVIILLVVGVILTFLFHKTNLGKQILAIGDNARAARLSGVRVRLIRIVAFLISAITAVIAGVLIGGYGGTSILAGEGLEFQSVSAAVIGGALLLGGKGSVPLAALGALSLEAIFSLLNLLGLPKPYRDAVQGLILIGAVAYSSKTSKKRD
ncbi:MAG: ABC transporter permease [Anaerolineales bacterium]